MNEVQINLRGGKCSVNDAKPATRTVNFFRFAPVVDLCVAVDSLLMYEQARRHVTGIITIHDIYHPAHLLPLETTPVPNSNPNVTINHNPHHN